MSSKKNKSVKKKTTELSPETLERIRELEESGETFFPKMEPYKPLQDIKDADASSLMKKAKYGGAVMKKRGGTFKGTF